MTDNKKHSFRAPLAAILAALIGATALLAGCGGNSESEGSSENETRVVTETQVVTRVVDGVYTDENGNPIKDENGQPMTAPSGTPDTEVSGGSANNGNGTANNANGNGGAAANSGSASSSAGGNSANNNGGSGSSASQADDKSSSSKADDKSGDSEKKGSGTLSVGGKTYNVGDKVTCTYTLTCKKLLSNFQAMVKYDNKYLKPTNAYLDGPAKAGSVIKRLLTAEAQLPNLSGKSRAIQRTTRLSPTTRLIPQSRFPQAFLNQTLNNLFMKPAENCRLLTVEKVQTRLIHVNI